MSEDMLLACYAPKFLSDNGRLPHVPVVDQLFGAFDLMRKWLLPDDHILTSEAVACRVDWPYYSAGQFCLRQTVKRLHDASGKPANGAVQVIPEFDAIIGNFPYINAANVEKREKGYLDKVNLLLANEWLVKYPDGFEFGKKAEQREFQQALEQGLDLTQYIPN